MDAALNTHHEAPLSNHMRQESYTVPVLGNIVTVTVTNTAAATDTTAASLLQLQLGTRQQGIPLFSSLHLELRHEVPRAGLLS